MSIGSPLRLLALAAFGIVLCSGCYQRDNITRYTVSKPPPIKGDSQAGLDPHAGLNLGAPAPTGEPRDRTLAAIVTAGDQGWFFKLTGPKDAVAERRDDFDAFLTSIAFADDGKPRWTVPSGWQEQPGGDIRYATLVFSGEAGQKPLELTVTALPFSGDRAGYLLANVNRWRGQLSLAPWNQEELAAEVKEVPLDTGTAGVVDLVGTASGAGMGGPFMSGARDGN